MDVHAPVSTHSLHMVPDLEILLRVLRDRPATTLQPRAFFIAWSGVPTLVYAGFSPTLLAIKQDLEAHVPGLQEENPGSRWPKTTLGALREGQQLAWEDVLALRDICDDVNRTIERNNAPLTVDALTAVWGGCRSLETCHARTTLPLTRSRPINTAVPPDAHRARVEHTLQQFARSHLSQYWDDLRCEGNHARHYRTEQVEPTLVHFLKEDPAPIDTFIRRVDDALPGMYNWFAPHSRHLTVRTLAVEVTEAD